MAGLILIVEDEQDLVRTLEYNLRREGYQTRAALNGSAALEMARTKPLPDLVLLDLMLPDASGNDICRQLKADDDTRAIPIIMVTARGEEIDRVVGFEVGADDYVVKPYSVRELLLRIRAVLRRATPSAPPVEHNETRFGILRIDRAGHRCWVGAEEVLPTALEFKLLTTLHDRRGRVQTRDMLLADVWGIEAEVTTRTVDTHVKRLRQKLGPAGRYIETLRGVGYRFQSQPDGDGT
jgi:two-component system phosphate regulon response regulator PhoB